MASKVHVLPTEKDIHRSSKVTNKVMSYLDKVVWKKEKNNHGKDIVLSLLSDRIINNE